LSFEERIKFDSHGLVPAIIQNVVDGTVLMMAYMNRESLQKTLDTGYTWFYSRSRQSLWNKGESSGNVQKVRQILYDCDGDTLLIKVEQTGVACHEGTYSCFSREIETKISTENRAGDVIASGPAILTELYEVIDGRKKTPQEGSYTTYLFTKGQDKILKKVGEESAETIIGSKNNNSDEVVYEMADLWYHCMVLLVWHNIPVDRLFAELGKRRKPSSK